MSSIFIFAALPHASISVSFCDLTIEVSQHFTFFFVCSSVYYQNSFCVVTVTQFRVK